MPSRGVTSGQPTAAPPSSTRRRRRTPTIRCGGSTFRNPHRPIRRRIRRVGLEATSMIRYFASTFRNPHRHRSRARVASAALDWKQRRSMIRCGGSTFRNSIDHGGFDRGNLHSKSRLEATGVRRVRLVSRRRVTIGLSRGVFTVVSKPKSM